MYNVKLVNSPKKISAGFVTWFSVSIRKEKTFVAVVLEYDVIKRQLSFLS